VATQSGKQKSSASTNNSLRGLNFPPLDRIVLKSNNNKLPVISVGAEERKYQIGGGEERKYQIDHRSLEGMLRIEGRSQGRQEYEHE
jgi:hypothetical protein